jgi:hypothetical protein
LAIAPAQTTQDKIDEMSEKLRKEVLKAFPELTKEPTEAEKRAQFNTEMARIKKDPKDFAEIVTGLQVGLANLGYGTRFTGEVDQATREALKEYQRFSGLKPTGDIDYDTWVKLSEDYPKEPPPVLPVMFVGVDSWEAGFVLAEGTWTSKDTDQEMGLPIQTSRITCYKNSGCTEAVAMVMYNGGTASLHVDETEYEIERWDDVEIVTKPLQAQCARTILRVNRTQKLVTSLRSTIKNTGQCENMTKSDWLIELKSGVDVYMKEQKKLSAANRKVTRMGANAVRLPLLDPPTKP